MSLVYHFHEILFHSVHWLFFFLIIFFSSFDEIKIGLVALKEKFISEVNTVFVTTNFMESVHVELQINIDILVWQKIKVFHVWRIDEELLIKIISDWRWQALSLDFPSLWDLSIPKIMIIFTLIIFINFYMKSGI